VGINVPWMRTGDFGEVGLHGAPGVQWRDNVYLTYTWEFPLMAIYAYLMIMIIHTVLALLLLS